MLVLIKAKLLSLCRADPCCALCSTAMGIRCKDGVVLVSWQGHTASN